MDNPSPASKCSQSKCNQPLLENSKYKTCERCREQNQVHTKRKRERQKHEELLTKKPRGSFAGDTIKISDDTCDEDEATDMVGVQNMLSSVHTNKLPRLGNQRSFQIQKPYGRAFGTWSKRTETFTLMDIITYRPILLYRISNASRWRHRSCGRLQAIVSRMSLLSSA